MKRFRFKLQPVLDLRCHLENEQKDALTRERQKLAELQLEEEQLRKKSEYWSNEYLKKADSGMMAEEAVRIDNFIQELSRQIAEVLKKQEVQAEVVEKTRIELVNKMKDRKTLDKLFEKQSDKFYYEENHKDEKAVEELITERMPR